MSAERWENVKENVLSENSSSFARIYLYPKDDFLTTYKKGKEGFSEKDDAILSSLLTEDVFFNYKPGLLKNYFQIVNNELKNEKIYFVFEKDFMPELKNLTKQKLYIPSYITIKHSLMEMSDSEEDESNIKEIFKKYDYQYEIISDQELSDRIMRKEEFYYLRYVRMNLERFIQVVNSKTGETVHRDYVPGMLTYNLKSKDINKLNKNIAKALKSK